MIVSKLQDEYLRNKGGVRQRVKILRHFSLYEILRLAAGKIFSQLRSATFMTLQDKENKLAILYRYGSSVRIENGHVNLAYNPGHVKLNLFLRLSGSDVWGFNQVFINREYDSVMSVYRDRFHAEPQTMVDAGANVGLVSLFFKVLNPALRILAIEPDEDNCNLARANVAANFFESVVVQQLAIWPTRRQLQIVNDFRDYNPWSLRVEEQQNGTINSITPPEAIDYFGEAVDIFKMDIEGAEAKIFAPDNDLDWLRKIKLIAIEIHEEFAAKRFIIDILNDYGFEIIQHGELSIGINLKALKT
jgi:FkbM family methyltransferase